jgi:glycosyltransferase involved in cell wall biosynthesis
MNPITWLFFGDDWGAHPSTTQHLARAIPADEPVAWVDSLTMRSLRPHPTEVLRVARRLRGRLRPAGHAPSGRCPDLRLTPRVLPLHGPVATQANRLLLRRPLQALVSALGAPPVVVVANPVAARHLDNFPHRAVVYLRLDDYARLPGVDADVVARVEPGLLARADVVAATARALLPGAARRSLLLPQGVDTAHFGQAPTSPPGSRVVGFFGLLAPWLDEALIVAAARAHPTWTFEFIGPVAGGGRPAFVDAAPNIRWRGAVPYADLPRAIAGWQAAWIPFKVDALTTAVNPVKLREYLAAGLPVFSTPLPESAAVSGVCIGDDAAAVGAFLTEAAVDDEARRCARRAAMQGHGWSARLASLRAAVRSSGHAA